MPACQTFQADIGSNAHDLPFLSSAGMSLSKCYKVIDFNVFHPYYYKTNFVCGDISVFYVGQSPLVPGIVARASLFTASPPGTGPLAGLYPKSRTLQEKKITPRRIWPYEDAKPASPG